MTRYIIIAAALLMMAPLRSQQNPLHAPRINGWTLWRVSPDPINIFFDTLNTGTQIIPYEEGSSDSVQLFKQYGQTRRFQNEWLMAVEWDKRDIREQPNEKPITCLIDLRIQSFVNVQTLLLLLTTIDTNNGGLSRANFVELQAEWQTIVSPVGGNVFRVQRIIFNFHLFGADSTYIGAEILCNNMRFVYPNGDTLLVDPFQYTFPSGIVEELPGVPTGFILHQNYPNPFNPSTKIQYEIQEPGNVKLSVFSLLGEKITDLVDQYQTAGIYEAEFSPKNLASGTYIYILQTDKFSLKRKMSFIK